MPIRHCIVHLIEKKPDGTPAVLHARDVELGESQAIDNLLADLNESYNAKQGKAWGFFHAESGAYPFSGWLKRYQDGEQDFAAFSRARGGAPAEADGGIQPVRRRPRAVRPLPAGHDRLPGHRAAAPQRGRGGDRHAGRDAGQAPGPGPVAPGGAHQPVRMAAQPAVPSSTSRSSRASTARRSRSTSATSSAARKASMRRARRARCSRRSAISSKARTWPRSRPARRPARWSTTPPARPGAASR